MVMDELESALAQQAPPKVQEDPSLFELPPLIIDGIPTPVEKMTQAQLRAFIPLMLKYSTGMIDVLKSGIQKCLNLFTFFKKKVAVSQAGEETQRDRNGGRKNFHGRM